MPPFLTKAKISDSPDGISDTRLDIQQHKFLPRLSFPWPCVQVSHSQLVNSFETFWRTTGVVSLR